MAGGMAVHTLRHLAVLGLLLVAAAGPAADPEQPGDGFLKPIPDRGAVPPIVEPAVRPVQEALAFRARARGHAQHIRQIRREHLGKIRVRALRDQGIAELRKLEDPAAFGPLVEELKREQDDVRLAVLDHLAGRGDAGQAALARVAIYDASPAIRAEAVARLVAPASKPVLRVLDEGLRSPVHDIANRAGIVAGATFALESIPLLIFAQSTADPVETEGDLAWIAVGTQRAFVAGIEPVVGDGAGAFRPIPGILQEGVILRVVDAVAIFYRTEIHYHLVLMTTHDWGQPTDHLAYDMRAWWHWYNDEYVPFKNEQIAEARMAGRRDAPPDSGPGGQPSGN
jgi:hypothetical protein